MREARLEIVKVAETRFVLERFQGAPWEVWTTDSSADAERLAEFAGRACYQSWKNPSGRRNAEYLANILAHEHFSVLEHAGFTVILTGVSRSFTHEFVRHRHLSPSQLSQRYFNEAAARAVVPPLFREDPEARAILEEIHQCTLDAYSRLVELANRRLSGLEDATLRRKRAREAARAVLPNMTETHIVMSGNHRAWREFFEKRGSLHAEAEMREVAVRLFREVAQPMAPGIYQDFRVETLHLPVRQEPPGLEPEAVEVLVRAVGPEDRASGASPAASEPGEG
ncbi:FAD-dependent thymidylate synthase [Limnochorda pilosa]|uniref:Flavin-dependent thymidylate synthase n=1 Tax=Limnochorda pilosa TaxID=1555112 RepID=A0A0K2SGS3_LIMPI|nr:FAD-dependent thymidylate synthase [Limnochorda pilosa]BAS26039.1 FAD-dependent thymidylate synthase [Limnochorda pilosa]